MDTSEFVCIKTEYCDGGNLKEYLVRHLNEQQKIDIYDIFNQVNSYGTLVLYFMSTV